MISETYEKSGRTLRLEWSSRGVAVIDSVEGGVAETSDTFHARATGERMDLPLIDRHAVEEMAGRARDIAGDSFERLSLASGRAVHRLTSGTDSRTWEEEQTRLFVSLRIESSTGPVRCPLLLGGAGPTDIDLRPLQSVMGAVGRRRGGIETRELMLEPQVAAPILAEMAGEADFPGLTVIQGLHPQLVVDGRGTLIQRFELGKDGPRWPNVYRPSYRFGPVHAPFHAVGIVELAGIAAPVRAVARLDAGGRTAFLCDDGESCDVVEMTGFRSVRAVDGDSPVWFPYGAGVWGSHLVLSW